MRQINIILDMELDMATIKSVKAKFNRENLKGHAIALIIINQQVLLIKRTVSRTRNNLCLPGGNVRKSESFKEGIIREMKEELDITLINPKPVAKIINRFIIDGKLIMESPGWIYLIDEIDGTPKVNSTEIEAIELCDAHNLPDLKFKNKEIIGYILNKKSKPIHLIYTRN
jgi:8-oxo-dGTP pyrophosphatase MutT (NUDIX family)